MPTKPSPSKDLTYMKRAIAIAENARSSTPPNPWVGTVIVRDSQILSEAHTSPYGGPHAEVNALKPLSMSAKNATAYVTLEPCCHFGKTPPCTDALIQSGISRVVIALKDPDANVAGLGMQKLLNAGIQVDLGVGVEEATASLAPYLHHRKTGRPYCVLKAATSIDGRLAAADGSSKWITGPESRSEVQRIRSHSQAIMIGAETAIRDQPRLNLREQPSEAPLKQPLRVIVDSHARVPLEGDLFNTEDSPTLLFTCIEPPKDYLDKGVDLVQVKKGKGGIGVDLGDCLDELGQRGILQLMIEGGGSLFNSFLQEGYVNKLILFQGACSLGDQGTPLFSGPGPRSISEAKKWKLLQLKQFANDVMMEYELDV
ncbi:Riboflavin biosynthesis protein RibD [Chlamydiales bacterium SCGC AG-110-M15]|nr:Riboflavin biosynthesis protein RibD [Chlamydiales bacterium SCGC AG-110-M15]